MEEKEARRRRFIINVLYWALIAALAWFVFKYFINIVMPFFIALIIAAIARPLARVLSGTTKKPVHIGNFKPRRLLAYNVAAIVSVVLLYLVIAGLLTLIIVPSVSSLTRSASELPQLYTERLLPALSAGGDIVENWIKNLNPQAASIIDNISSGLLSSLGSAVTSLSAKAVTLASNIVTGIPGTLLQALICMIASVFIAVDMDRMRQFIQLNLPENVYKVVSAIKYTLTDSIWKFIRSYFFIFLITMAEITVGLLLIGIRYPLLIGFAVAVFDAMPIVGSGMVMLPWSIVTLIVGDTRHGIGLFCLYLIVVVARQFLEPKIVGRQVGLRPIVTLFLMYLGSKLFGVLGLFGLPITAAILVQLNDTGYKFFRRVE